MATLLSDYGWECAACPPVVACPTNLLKDAVSAIAVGKKIVVSSNATPDIVTGKMMTGSSNSVSSGVILGSNTEVLVAGTLSQTSPITCAAFSCWLRLDPYWNRFEVGSNSSNNVVITSYYLNGVSISLSTNTWYYIMVTQVDTTIALYVNGGLVNYATRAAGAINNGYITGGSSIKDLLFFTSIPSTAVPTTLAGFV